jgi:hypothetical protein
VTTTISPAHAANLLREALDNVFAQGFDERLMASMPDFWKLYYQAVAAKSDYRPTDPDVLRQSTVDKKAQLTSKFEPDSTEYVATARSGCPPDPISRRNGHRSSLRVWGRCARRRRRAWEQRIQIVHAEVDHELLRPSPK